MTEPLDPSLLPEIGFLYLAFGQVTDNHLDADEMKVIADRLRRWFPRGSQLVVTDLLREVVDEFRALTSEDERRMRASDCAHDLKDHLSELQRKQIVADVMLIAKADGRITDGELGFVSALTSIFGIDAGAALELNPASKG